MEVYTSPFWLKMAALDFPPTLTNFLLGSLVMDHRLPVVPLIPWDSLVMDQPVGHLQHGCSGRPGHSQLVPHRAHGAYGDGSVVSPLTNSQAAVGGWPESALTRGTPMGACQVPLPTQPQSFSLPNLT